MYIDKNVCLNGQHSFDGFQEAQVRIPLCSNSSFRRGSCSTLAQRVTVIATIVNLIRTRGDELFSFSSMVLNPVT